MTAARTRRKKLDEEAIVRGRREGKSLRDLAREQGVSHHPIRRVLLKHGADASTDMRRRWTEEAAVEALRAWEARHGTQPGMRAWKGARMVPATSTIIELFGTWGNALVAAGMEALPPGDNRDYRERDAFDRESAELQERVDRGATLTELAAGLGVSPQALGRRLKRWRAGSGGGHREPTSGRPTGA